MAACLRQKSRISNLRNNRGKLLEKGRGLGGSRLIEILEFKSDIGQTNFLVKTIWKKGRSKYLTIDRKSFL